MRNLILSGVAAIALATVPALAQETDNDANASAPADQAAPQHASTAARSVAGPGVVRIGRRHIVLVHDHRGVTRP